ncbi:MAG: hypothetical protein ABMA64_39830 [Myxococcota bacterium]
MLGSALADEVLFGSVSVVLVASVFAAMAAIPAEPHGSSSAPVVDLVEAAPARFVDISSFAVTTPPSVAAGAADTESAEVEPAEGPSFVAARSEAAPAAARVGRARAARATPVRKSRAKPCEEPSDPAIRSTGDDRWTVDRDVLHRYTRDWSRLDELGWSKVHQANGEADGFQLGGVRCGSDLWDAGLRSGDVVHAVNGRSVHSVPQAVLAYTALRGEDRFVVRVTRKGESRTLRYVLD